MPFACSQCGGRLDVPADARFATCPFCASSVYLDRSRSVLRFVASPTLDEAKARGKLRAWMAGNETAKGLDVEARLGAARLRYFPVWRFVTRGEGGEAQWSEPARADAPAGLTGFPLPAGELRFFDAEAFSTLALEEPEVRLESALEWVSRRGIPRERIAEASLVHLPVFEFPYRWRGREFAACVDGITGRVLAAVFPTKTEAPYVGLAVAATLLYLVLGFWAESLLWRIVLYAIASVPVGIAAFTVARRV